MYLSKVMLNPASSQVRSELRDPYQMHRTLSRAFGDDPDSYKSARVLFRIERMRGGGAYVLVQSLAEPDWVPLESAAGYLAQAAQTKEVRLEFHKGQLLMFRLRANPTVKRGGKRWGLETVEEQIAWLRRKGQQHGFDVKSACADYGGKVKSQDHNSNHLAVTFEGVLEVTDVEEFRLALESGIGSAKGFGFGLLSIAPVRR